MQEFMHVVYVSLMQPLINTPNNIKSMFVWNIHPCEIP